MSVSSDARPTAALRELDHCLAPLRRVLGYAARTDGSEVRYLGATAGRWARKASAVAPELGVEQDVKAILEALDGIDELEGADRRARVQRAQAAVDAVDTRLGLPLEARSAPGAASSEAASSLDALLEEEEEGEEDPEPDAIDGAASEEADDPDEPDEDGLELDLNDLLEIADADADTDADTDADRDAGLLDLDALLVAEDDDAADQDTDRNRGRKRTSRRGSRGKRGRSKQGRRSGKREKKKSAASKAVEPDVPSIRYGDESLGGAALDALDVSDAVRSGLAEHGITTLDALLQRRPSGEQVVQPVLGAGRLTEPGRTAIGGRVRMRSTVLHPDGSRTTRVVLKGAGLTTACWQGGAPTADVEALAPGQRAVLVGHAVQVDEGFELHDPEPGVDDGKHAVRLARYGLDGVDDRELRGVLRQVLPQLAGLQDPVPGALRGKVGLGDALLAAHTRGIRATDALARLAYDEALLVQLGLLWPRYARSGPRGLAHTLLHGLASRVLQHVEVELTDEQQAAFEDVKRDLRAPTPMRRVLTGEVGAGKGLVALLSTALVAENKHQVMILAPDQATADQRYAFTEPLLRELGLVARLYTDPPSKAQRDAIKRGEVHVLFGTHALLQADVETRRLGLVIAGERDVFGQIPDRVDALRGPSPDLLVITSTPVPVPVLLAAYPTFDHTVLRHLPGQPVPATAVTAEARSTAYGAAAEAVNEGQQAVVVFPLSRGADVLDVREALHVVSTLQERVFPGKRVKLFHGAMSRDERFRTYTDFRNRRIDVLVATTHFEAGPSVANNGVVVIEQADRMPLSRMHRVRGHLSVSRHQPRCWLVTGEHPDEEGLTRVERFAASQDGFAVSAQELAHRGLDDMVATTPGTVPRFSWVDPLTDIDVLVRARVDARKLLSDDPGLRSGGRIELARYLKARWDTLLGGDCPVQVSASGSSRRRRRRRRR